jgi:hypothetical protein
MNMVDGKPQLGLSIPVLEMVYPESFPWQLATACEMGVFTASHGWPNPIIICPPGLMPHDSARTTAFEMAFETGVDYLLFVDQDTVLPRGAVSRLYKTLTENNAAVVSGRYVRRGFPYTCVWSAIKDGKWCQVDAGGGVHQILTSGLGCALIDLRWVHAHIRPPFFYMRHNGRSTLVTDDVTFFETIHEAGGLVLGDAEVHCAHFGRREMCFELTESALRKTHIELFDNSGDDVVYKKSELPRVNLEAETTFEPLPRREKWLYDEKQFIWDPKSQVIKPEDPCRINQKES